MSPPSKKTPLPSGVKRFTIPTIPVPNTNSEIPPTPTPLIKPPPSAPPIKQLLPPVPTKPVIGKPPKPDQPKQVSQDDGKSTEMTNENGKNMVKNHSTAHKVIKQVAPGRPTTNRFIYK
ncbi:hypothetical protein CHUAL_007778 [Chamberlinius hualienensis]